MCVQSVCITGAHLEHVHVLGYTWVRSVFILCNSALTVFISDSFGIVCKCTWVCVGIICTNM